MSMSSGGPSAPQRQPSMGRRNISRAITMRTDGYSGEEEGPIIESELVPSSLAPIVPILRAANEIEDENPRVAYLCRFTAFEKAHTMDPNSSGRGVRQFKTYLLHRLEKDEKDTQRRLASTDAKEIQRFYEHYCKKYLEEGLQTRKPDEMARYYQIASVLYDVLKTVTPDKPNSEYDQYAKGVEKEKASFSHYNILPLNISGPTQPVMEIPEIKAAVAILRKINNLPTPRPDTTNGPQGIDDGPIVRDLLDWLWQTFGFQKGNVENQKEHLILLLANIDMRGNGNVHQGERQNHMEATMSKRGTVSHSKWRNYDDLNEYFWSKKCFKQLGWPMDPASDFFADPTETKNDIEAMVIIAWSPSGSLSAIFEPAVFRNVMTIFITAAFLNFLQVQHNLGVVFTIWAPIVMKEDKNLHIDKFSDIWNAFIISLRDEDLINNRERDLLIVPSSAGDTSVFQWPPFLLASKIPMALDMAKSVKKRDEELRKRINQDPYTFYAVIECYETLLNILYSLMAETSDKKVVDRIRESLEDSIERQSLVREFRLDELPQLSAKFDKLLTLLLKTEEEHDTTIKTQIANLLQDTMEIITQDIMKNGQGILKDENRDNQLFANLNLDSIKDEAWREKCVRLQLLLTTKESAIYVPTNLEARRRITFFANSLFMKMPRAPQVRSMMSFRYPSLRIAYIDEVEAPTKNGTTEKTYYSVLVKGVGEKYDEEIYRIKLPGKPTDIGEGKPENQNHAIIFTRGEALQAIDMNQDNYLEEAFKMRNVLEEFGSDKYGKSKPTILGLREHIFTGSVSSLAWFMSNQETSFVTIGQRVLANPLKVRFHYGHPDIFDRLFHITRGGISKASKTINLSEDIFSGFNSTMREGNITHHEYMQVGKGRDVGMNQISSFEAKVANGNGEQTLSRDIYRLGRRFDFYRMLSFYFTTVGFYFSSMVTVLTVYVFLYGRLYLVMSGLEKSILLDPRIKEDIKPLENALASQSVFQLGLLLVLPMVMEVGLEKGFRTALGEFIIMQLQLASVFFTFQLGTKTHYYGRTILHGGAKYRPTGRGFVVYHAKFADNYRMYSRSHFVKGLELLILLVVYLAYGKSYRSTSLYLFVTFSIWFLVASWLFAPFIFNPSCFEWQKTVDDWTDWRKWMGNRGGIGMSVDQSWEAWWIGEQEHLRKTSIRALVLEILLSLRFLIYQYGIVYHLNIARRSTSILVYGLSWLVMLTVLVVLKMVSIGRQKFGTDLQLMFRILKGLLFLGFISVMSVLFVVCSLTISDVFASILGFLPTGWCILLIGQACAPLIKKTTLWDSIMELGRAYDNIMGLVLFLPIGFLSWFPFVSEFQTRLLFNQAFSRGLQISRILAGQKDIGEFE
ncbi:unnamed protein product [Triticum turgidum subsp. durum]|uniref:1,3-beta-glucan synthase n=1 Tax=Triticum turgidum subsp. durum TaxID=4567 RepID=A0A9R0RIU8_TRITD|nr:unnamed protein product [Triticum turgidum subsp. durum]